VTDQTARLVAERLTAALKQSVVVDNRPGANGIIAAEAAARAAPDGYTLLYAYSAVFTINPWINAKLPFDPLKDFTPIARPSSLGGNVLIVSSSVPAKNLKELVAYVAGSKEELSYCSWGIGSGGHLSMEYLKTKTGMKLRHIPYKTAVQCTNDVAAGHTTIAFSDTVSVLPHIRSGRIRVIASVGKQRPLPPADAPTLAEQGVPYQQASWTALFGPKGLPAPVVARLNAEVNAILKSPAEQKRFESLNVRLGTPSTPEELGELVKQDLAAWGEIAKTAGVVPE
jgi:tripartite-type tricarboxylate transporter receptor subunit TctC